MPKVISKQLHFLVDYREMFNQILCRGSQSVRDPRSASRRMRSLFIPRRLNVRLITARLPCQSLVRIPFSSLIQFTDIECYLIRLEVVIEVRNNEVWNHLATSNDAYMSFWRNRVENASHAYLPFHLKIKKNVLWNFSGYTRLSARLSSMHSWLLLYA